MSKFKNQVELVSPKYDHEVTNPIPLETPGVFDVSGTQYGDTGWLPNFNAYTIEQTISGELEVLDSNGDATAVQTQRTEARVLTHDETVLGSELVDNGSFTGIANGTNITTLPNWGASGSATGTIQNEELVVVTTADYNAIVHTTPLVVGKTYRVSFDLKSGAGRFYSAPVGHQTLSIGNTIYIFEATATDNDIQFGLVAGSPGTAIFDNISLKEIFTENKLYINGVFRYTPSTPSTATTIKANTTASIGYADTVDTHYGDLKCWSIARTAAQILIDHNNWILANEDVLTDGDGDYLTDDDGVYLYV